MTSWSTEDLSDRRSRGLPGEDYVSKRYSSLSYLIASSLSFALSLTSRLSHSQLRRTGSPLLISKVTCLNRTDSPYSAALEQMDLHDPTATVREALIFSALLRQPADTPYEEKIAFVDTVIDLLELTDLQHAFIGNGLAGESKREQSRKGRTRR